MPGLMIVLPQDFTDPTLPVLKKYDPLESPGSLLLVEPGHPTAPWSGIPASLAAVKNILWESAAAMYGGGAVEADTAATIKYANLDGTVKGKIERTAKGGLHAIVSQSPTLVGGSQTTSPFLEINLPAKFREYQFLHPNNDLYVSMWGNISRAIGAAPAGYSPGATSIYSLYTSSNNQRVAGGNKVSVQNSLGSRGNQELATGQAFLNAGSNAWTTAPSSATSAIAGMVTVGHSGANNTYLQSLTTAQARWPSWVIYRVYAEDLTVSGRTYAQVDALDFAEYTKQVLTAGGRYYGDTFTNPATIP